MLYQARYRQNILYEVLRPTTSLMYAIWYIRNLVKFQGQKSNALFNLNLIKSWQIQYINQQCNIDRLNCRRFEEQDKDSNDLN